MSSTVHAQDGQHSELSLDESVQKALLAATSQSFPAPKNTLRRIEREWLVNGGAFKEILDFTYYDNGLLGVNSTTVSVNNRSTIDVRASSLSIAGFLTVSEFADSHAETAVSTALPLGKVAIPFTWRSSSKSASSSTVKEFSGDLGNVFRPGAGQKFTMRLTRMALSDRRTGLLSNQSRHENTFSVECTNGDERDAAEIHPAFTGKFIDVACNYVNDKAGKSLRTLAYLIDTRVYLTRTISFGRNEQSYKVTNVEYNP